MTTKGYIQLHRKLYSHWLWQEPRTYSRAEAWIDLLLRAQWADAKILWYGQMVDLKRGELVTSQNHLMRRWGWSNTKVRGFLELLVAEGMVEVQAYTKYTHIGVVAYNDHQGLGAVQKVFS